MLNTAPDFLSSLTEAPPISLRVKRLALSSFRNYSDLCLDLSGSPVVITGANGTGKTNLLESISLLVPGRGLRRADMGDLQNRFATVPWAVAINVDNGYEQILIGTGRDPQSNDVSDRRVVHIDGKPARAQSILAEHIAMAWITPAMDRLLAEGPSARRKWLDRLTYSFDPAHAGRITRYEKAMRERLRLLREQPGQTSWMTGLENDMAQSAIAIADARRRLVNCLRDVMTANTGIFPQADIVLIGFAERELEESPALLVEDRLRAALALARSDDAQSGTCSVGTHRSDLLVTHHSKNCPADLCSTGEQKALMIAIMLAYVRILIRHRAMTPIFLLDDIVAHLDDRRRDALFQEINELGVQAWLTGTDTEHFSSFLSHAQHITTQG